MRFGLALDLWCKGDPDAPEPPKPRTPADKARDELLEVCKKEGIAPNRIAALFTKDTGLSVHEADANTIRAFTKTLATSEVKP
jgi:hypothetical protein